MKLFMKKLNKTKKYLTRCQKDLISMIDMEDKRWSKKTLYGICQSPRYFWEYLTHKLIVSGMVWSNIYYLEDRARRGRSRKASCDPLPDFSPPSEIFLRSEVSDG